MCVCVCVCLCMQFSLPYPTLAPRAHSFSLFPFLSLSLSLSLSLPIRLAHHLVPVRRRFRSANALSRHRISTCYILRSDPVAGFSFSRWLYSQATCSSWGIHWHAQRCRPRGVADSILVNSTAQVPAPEDIESLLLAVKKLVEKHALSRGIKPADWKRLVQACMPNT